MNKMTEMWVALEAHEPAPSYAEAWERMLRERTEDAMWAAYYEAPRGSRHGNEAWAAWAKARDDRRAQHAIDAIREVQP
jgi:hypothetical protein